MGVANVRLHVLTAAAHRETCYPVMPPTSHDAHLSHSTLDRGRQLRGFGGGRGIWWLVWCSRVEGAHCNPPGLLEKSIARSGCSSASQATPLRWCRVCVVGDRWSLQLSPEVSARTSSHRELRIAFVSFSVLERQRKALCEPGRQTRAS